MGWSLDGAHSVKRRGTRAASRRPLPFVRQKLAGAARGLRGGRWPRLLRHAYPRSTQTLMKAYFPDIHRVPRPPRSPLRPYALAAPLRGRIGLRAWAAPATKSLPDRLRFLLPRAFLRAERQSFSSPPCPPRGPPQIPLSFQMNCFLAGGGIKGGRTSFGADRPQKGGGRRKRSLGTIPRRVEARLRKRSLRRGRASADLAPEPLQL